MKVFVTRKITADIKFVNVVIEVFVTEFEILLPNEKLDGDKYEYNYEIDIDKIELEFSDIYELYS